MLPFAPLSTHHLGAKSEGSPCEIMKADDSVSRKVDIPGLLKACLLRYLSKPCFRTVAGCPGVWSSMLAPFPRHTGERKTRSRKPPPINEQRLPAGVLYRIPLPAHRTVWTYPRRDWKSTIVSVLTTQKRITHASIKIKSVAIVTVLRKPETCGTLGAAVVAA